MTLLVRRSTARRKSTSTPNSTASSSAISGSSVAAMLLIVPSSSSLPRIVRAGTPMASEKLRTVQGSSTTRCSCAGRPCWCRCRLMCVRLRSERRGDRPRRPAFRPPRAGGRLLAFELPLLAAAQGRGGSAFLLVFAGGDAPPRRGRSRPRAAPAGAGGPVRGGRCLAAGLGGLGGVRFCSCLRRCSDSGLVPALLARMASAGSLMSGFCGAGSAGFGRAAAGRWRQRGQLDRRPLLSLVALSRGLCASVLPFSSRRLPAAVGQCRWPTIGRESTLRRQRGYRCCRRRGCRRRVDAACSLSRRPLGLVRKDGNLAGSRACRSRCSPRGGTPACRPLSSAPEAATAAAAAVPPCRWSMNAVTATISSSVRLASAEPFPVTPALVQMSTSTLLSSFSSFANA